MATTVRRLQAGDRGAARELYEAQGAALLRVARGLLGSTAQAEDALHDAFVEFIRRPEGYDPARGSLFLYLCGIVRHVALRQRARSLRWVSTEEADVTRDDGPDIVRPVAAGQAAAAPDESAERALMVERLQRACDRLPTAFREAFVLCDIEELSYEEAAMIMECPIGTVRSRLSRARTLLARALETERPPAIAAQTRGHLPGRLLLEEVKT